MTTIHLQQIGKVFAKHEVLRNLELDIRSGEFVTLLGPSGCGKTTLLRIIAGLEQADSGAVLIDGKHANRLSPQDRKVGFVFQHYALFRHMSIFDNIAFGLRMRPRSLRPSRVEIGRKVEELLNLVQLDGFANRYPHQLSGGQRQRTALARALAVEPKILLLDEPFGALDAQVRKDLRQWLRDLQQRLAITTVLVTHDQEEAMDMADRVVLMNHGRIEQEGAPEELFANPISPFALKFLGAAQELSLMDHEYLNSENPTPGLVQEKKKRYLRPHELKIQAQNPGSAGQSATIRRISWRGAWIRLLLEQEEPGKSALTAELGREYWESLQLKVGDKVFWQPERLHSFQEV
ncbi:MAG: sulfate/molybdate ABC transporter ATP-binding protein [Oligoflexus sp.]